ncbi:MAG: hypothetical protein Q8K93_17160, partial [Reyranella sp.]|nr:hypothetical protein [Reyranella sp.]
GAGPIAFAQWPTGLNMLFQDGAFVGWSVNRDPAGKLTTLNGIGLGASRAALKAGYSDFQPQESTLGEEFTAGGLSGLLDGKGAKARVEALWAGTSCVFR